MFFLRWFPVFAMLLFAAPAFAQTGPCAGPSGVGYMGCGQDYSANPAAVPIGGYTLLSTIPAAPRRSIEIDNQSTSWVQVIRDDGNGNQISSVMLAPASVAPGQGGSWGSYSFQGRVRVYAASAGAQVAIYQD